CPLLRHARDRLLDQSPADQVPRGRAVARALHAGAVLSGAALGVPLARSDRGRRHGAVRRCVIFARLTLPPSAQRMQFSPSPNGSAPEPWQRQRLCRRSEFRVSLSFSTAAREVPMKHLQIVCMAVLVTATFLAEDAAARDGVRRPRVVIYAVPRYAAEPGTIY